MKVKYNCKDNDVKLQFHLVDGKIDEVWVQIQGEKTWTVIGYNDLLSGIKKAEQFCKNDVVGSFNLFKMKPEKKLKLSIEALDNFGVYPEVIKDMLNDLNKLVAEKKSERIAKEHFRKQRDNCLIELQDRKDMGY